MKGPGFHATSKKGDFVAMLVDSEDPMSDVEKAWEHLKTRDDWDKPDGAVDGQVLLMTTCMETWIAADRDALKQYYGHKLQENALPPLHDLEKRGRHDVLAKLEHATRHCGNERCGHLFSFISPVILKTPKPHYRWSPQTSVARF